jgi:hypothetical protein
MKGRITAALFLCSLFITVGGDAQNRGLLFKPVWTLEYIQVTPEQLGLAMGYLDDNWMRVRAEAEKEGAVLDYHLIHSLAQAVPGPPGYKVGDSDSIVLVTEYKNMAAFQESEKLFASIRERLPKSTPGVFKPSRPVTVPETVDSRVFVEEPEVSGGFKLLVQK